MLESAGEDPWGHEIKDLTDLLLGLRLAPADKIGKYGDPSALAPTIFAVVGHRHRRHGGMARLHDICHWDPGHRYDGTRWANDATSRHYVDEAQKFADIINDMIISFSGVL